MNLTGASISHARVVDVTIDALVENVVINGVDVTAFVNEHDPWNPLREPLDREVDTGASAAASSTAGRAVRADLALGPSILNATDDTSASDPQTRHLHPRQGIDAGRSSSLDQRNKGV